jgi:uncharacterized protein (DUF952 family)
MNVIYHLAPAARWYAWPAGVAYLPEAYEADGFVHCTAGDELMLRVANAFYRDSLGEFVLLVIDPARLSAPLKWERSADGLATDFPHIYGPIDTAAVVKTRQVRRADDGTFVGWADG